MRMLDDARAGKIDLILTKSISRFARNTLDLLNVVRELKDLGVEVIFEKERIASLSGDGELMLTLLASFAQEETISISNNVKWGIRKRMQQGQLNGHFRITGYRWEGDTLVIYEPEAQIVRRIYKRYLEGASRVGIAKELNDEHITTIFGNAWEDSNVKAILRNITYTGNLLFQKEYIKDPISQQSKINRGELPQYFVENTHEAIIEKDVWDKVQAEFERRRKAGARGNPAINTTCFTSLLRCARCGYNYRRSSYGVPKRGFWGCYGKEIHGRASCPTENIPEDALKAAVAQALELEEFDEDIFSEKVEYIDVHDERVLHVHFLDGTEAIQRWKPLTNRRRDYWTEERRRAYSQSRRCKHKWNSTRRATPFTGLVRCAKCHNNFKAQIYRSSDGSTRYTLSCSTKRSECENSIIHDNTLKDLVCEVLGLAQFDEATMDKHIELIEVEDFTVTFHFLNGEVKHLSYTNPERKYPRSTKKRQAERYATSKGI